MPSHPNKSALARSQIDERTSEALAGLEVVECVAWEGPSGQADRDGNPTSWAPGFIYDIANGLEAFILPLTLIRRFNLEMSYGFWGMQPDQTRGGTYRDSVPANSGPTTDDLEKLYAETLPDGEYNSVYQYNLDIDAAIDVVRAHKLKIIRENLVRVRISTGGDKLRIHPTPDKFHVVALGAYPQTVRVGILVHVTDSSGNTQMVQGSNTLTPEQYEEYLRQKSITDRGTGGFINGAIRSAATLNRTRHDGQAGGIPRPNQSFYNGVFNAQGLVVEASPPPPLPAILSNEDPMLSRPNARSAELSLVDIVNNGLLNDPMFTEKNPDLRPKGGQDA